MRGAGAKKAKLLRPIPPDQPAARDEGPRLIPRDLSNEPSGLEHYLDLADTALGLNRLDHQAEIRSPEPRLAIECLAK